jgi:glycosyltransferase involved in cell wall biosynthesis
VEVVWNGVPETPPIPFPEGPPLIVFAGRLVPEKGADLLIRAFASVRARIPAARLLIAGDGPERPRLARLIEVLSLGSSVILAGHLPRARLDDRFRDAWVQVAPSLWDEPFGIVAAEALMRGTPLVATNNGGFSELVRQESTGLLVPAGDEASLSQAMLRMIDDRALAGQLAARGRQFALSHLTEAAFVERFVGIYEAMMSGSAECRNR